MPSEFHNRSFTIRSQSFTIRLQSFTIRRFTVSQSDFRVSQSDVDSFTIRFQSFTISLYSFTIRFSSFTIQVAQSAREVSQSDCQVSQSKLHNPLGKFHNPSAKFHNPTLTIFIAGLQWIVYCIITYTHIYTISVNAHDIRNLSPYSPMDYIRSEQASLPEIGVLTLGHKWPLRAVKICAGHHSCSGGPGHFRNREPGHHPPKKKKLSSLDSVWI